MIKIILASHGDFCLGLKQTAEMIAGKIDDLEIESFRPGQDPEDYKTQFEKVIIENGKTTPILVLVDLKGGTPYNTAMYLSQSYNLRVITGVNLPMLLSLVTTRNDNSTIQQLVDLALKQQNWGIEEAKIGGHPHHAKLSLN